MKTKMCNACGITKPVSEFSRNSEVHDGYRYTCKICTKNKVPTNPEFTRLTRKRQDPNRRIPYGIRKEVGGLTIAETNRLHKYGLTKAQFEVLEKEQDGKCAICAEPLPVKFCIDHCHRTGKVRGLLCYRCNNGIGQLDDNPALLTAALAYLTAHSSDDMPCAQQV